ncbi:membrane-associating domain-containing protein [Scheffersomyces coipomensis]|uniref:membrane-associating domain-containing protein n=1 Tax=Scheffersomyces coipomensis TaxID=1788519 RepID=UPI00315DF203
MNLQFIVTILRALQLFFSVLVLCLTAATLGLASANSSSVSFNLATSILTLVYFGYLTFLHVKQANTVISFPILVVEAILTILWLSAFADITNFAGPLSCSYGYYGYYYDEDNVYSRGKHICELAKATIAFSLFNWLLFTATLILFVIYTFIPLTKVNNFDYTTKTQSVFQPGAIFLATPIQDKESNVGISDNGNETDIHNDKLEHSDHENIEDGEYKPPGTEITQTD